MMQQTRRCESAPTEQAEPPSSYDKPRSGFSNSVEACIQTDLDKVHVSGPHGQITPERARVSERRIVLPERLHIDLGRHG